MSQNYAGLLLVFSHWYGCVVQYRMSVREQVSQRPNSLQVSLSPGSFTLSPLPHHSSQRAGDLAAGEAAGPGGFRPGVLVLRR